MIPVGYMAKKVARSPEWLQAGQVYDILSVSSCVSEDFADWINFWKHNRYWFFNSPAVIFDLSKEHKFDLSQVRWFYYEIFENEYDYCDDLGWTPVTPEASLQTDVIPPASPVLMGYDVVTYSCGASAECSPLSCNAIAETLQVNERCLFETFDEAKQALESEIFKNCEPGPLRIFAVYEIPTPEDVSTSSPTVRRFATRDESTDS